MSVDKYLSIFLHQLEAVVYLSSHLGKTNLISKGFITQRNINDITVLWETASNPEWAN